MDEKIERPLPGSRRPAVFLPSYSPDLNPVEEFFSKLKHYLRKDDDIIEAISDLTHFGSCIQYNNTQRLQRLDKTCWMWRHLSMNFHDCVCDTCY